MKKEYAIIISILIFVIIVGIFINIEEKIPKDNGKAIAEYLVQSAVANDGVVDLSPFGEKVCIQPPGGFGKPMAMKQHARSVVFQESIESEGIWTISLERPDGVYVYAIPTTVVKWEVEGSDIPSKLASCPNSLLIKIVNSIPTLIVE